jgi:hypothetical protein
LKVIVERHGTLGRGEDDRTGDELFLRDAGKLRSRGLLLRHGHVARGLRETGELNVRDLGRVHPEAVHVHAVDGARIGHRLVPSVVERPRIGCAHRELTSRDP